MRIESNFCGGAKSKRTHAGDAGKPAAGLVGSGRCVLCHMVRAWPWLSCRPFVRPEPSMRCCAAGALPNSLEAATVMAWSGISSSIHTARRTGDAIIATERSTQRKRTGPVFIVILLFTVMPFFTALSFVRVWRSDNDRAHRASPADLTLPTSCPGPARVQDWS